MKIQYSSIKFWKLFKIKNIVAIILFCGLINSLNSVRDKCDIEYFLKMFRDINKTMHLAINNQYTQLFPTQIPFVVLSVVPAAQFESDIFNFLAHCVQPVWKIFTSCCHVLYSHDFVFKLFFLFSLQMQGANEKLNSLPVSNLGASFNKHFI